MFLNFHSLQAPKSDFQRGTILDGKSSVEISTLARNTRVLAEAIASQLYNSSGPFFVGDLVCCQLQPYVTLNNNSW